MDIVKRSSAGRGEYELAGTDGTVKSASLVDYALVLDLGEIGSINTGVSVKLQGGKRRLRRAGNHLHLHRQLEAVLLLPQSIRDERKLLGGQPTILHKQYVLRRITTDSLDVTASPKTATLSPVVIECDNGAQHAQQVDVTVRIDAIQEIWRRSQEFPIGLAQKLNTHEQLVLSGGPFNADVVALVDNIMRDCDSLAPDFNTEYIFGTDVLPVLMEFLPVAEAISPPQVDDIGPEDVELKRREAARWKQWVNARGANAARFRADVRNAYNSTCAVCGLRFPKTRECRIPGVDSAHILPWADYDLDEVRNGLCLCKLHHWAFDQLLIAIVPLENNRYAVVVTTIAEKVLCDDLDTLEELRRFEGVIDATRFPSNESQRPSAHFLRRFYEGVDIDVSTLQKPDYP